MSAQSQQSAAIVREEAARMGMSPAMTDAMIHIMMAESNGNPAAKASTSSASGLFQILTGKGGEWQDLIRRHPDIRGNSPSFDPFDARQNTRAALYMLAEKSQQMQHSTGHPATGGELYLSHFAGLTGATRIINAAPNTPMTQLMSPKAIAANSRLRFTRPDGTTVYLAQMTAADMRAWADQKMGGPGIPVGGPSGPVTPGMPGVSPDEDTTNPDSPNYVPPRQSEFIEQLLALFAQLLQSLFQAPQQPETPQAPSAPGSPPPAPPEPPRAPETYLQPALQEQLMVLNNWVPDLAATRSRMLRIFDTNRDQHISPEEFLRFDADGNGVVDLNDLTRMRDALRTAGVTVSPGASITDIMIAYREIPNTSARGIQPQVDPALRLDEHGLGTVSALVAQGVQVDLAGPNGANAPDGKFDQNDITVMADRLRVAGVTVQGDQPNAILNAYAQQYLPRQPQPTTPGPTP